MKTRVVLSVLWVILGVSTAPAWAEQLLPDGADTDIIQYRLKRRDGSCLELPLCYSLETQVKAGVTLLSLRLHNAVGQTRCLAVGSGHRVLATYAVALNPIDSSCTESCSVAVTFLRADRDEALEDALLTVSGYSARSDFIEMYRRSIFGFGKMDGFLVWLGVAGIAQNASMSGIVALRALLLKVGSDITISPSSAGWPLLTYDGYMPSFTFRVHKQSGAQ